MQRERERSERGVTGLVDPAGRSIESAHDRADAGWSGPAAHPNASAPPGNRDRAVRPRGSFSSMTTSSAVCSGPGAAPYLPMPSNSPSVRRSSQPKSERPTKRPRSSNTRHLEVRRGQSELGNPYPTAGLTRRSRSADPGRRPYAGHEPPHASRGTEPGLRRARLVTQPCRRAASPIGTALKAEKPRARSHHRTGLAGDPDRRRSRRPRSSVMRTDVNEVRSCAVCRRRPGCR